MKNYNSQSSSWVWVVTILVMLSLNLTGCSNITEGCKELVPYDVRFE